MLFRSSLMTVLITLFLQKESLGTGNFINLQPLVRAIQQEHFQSFHCDILSTSKMLVDQVQIIGADGKDSSIQFQTFLGHSGHGSRSIFLCSRKSKRLGCLPPEMHRRKLSSGGCFLIWWGCRRPIIRWNSFVMLTRPTRGVQSLI